MKDLRVGDILTFKDGEKLYLQPNMKVDDLYKYIYYDLYRIKIEDIIMVQRYTPSNKYKGYYDLYTIYECKEILDDKEKEYLRGVIKPFRNKIKLIKKEKEIFDNMNKISFLFDNNYGWYSLPPFCVSKNYYKQMELNKEYNLDELGLHE
ncbi:MAG: hypothetical protein HFI86_02160 [Bacilli bacterium]|nr:hypothetical protein [Bacilli bacterium]